MSGKIIVLEGAGDGIGKTTQLQMLYDDLKEDGYQVLHHHFPSYGTPQAAPVEQYLSGAYGGEEELSPYFVNALYAIDRVATWRTKLSKEYAEDKVILLDRYVTSSLIYQSADIDDALDKRDFMTYIDDYEYRKLHLPRPDAVIYLTAPLKLLEQMRAKRRAEDGDIAPDIHECDKKFMKRVYRSASAVASILKWPVVQCATKDGSAMRLKEDIHEEVYRLAAKAIEPQTIID